MELLFSFIAGVALSALIAFGVARSVVKSRVAEAERSARLQAESSLKVEQARLESDLEHTRRQLQSTRDEDAIALQSAKDEAAKSLEDTKAEMGKRYAEDLAARDNAHKEAMATLQARFDETMAKISAQVKTDTSEMLKAHQKEFAETSHQSLGQIVTPLKENIAELKKVMEEESKEQAERNGEMRERIKNLMEHSDAARKSADELAAAFKHGSKLQGDWGETIWKNFSLPRA